MVQEYIIEELNHGRKVIDFMNFKYFAFVSSVILLCTCLSIIFIKKFDWGIDFTGGTVIEMTLEKEPNLNILRHAIKQSGYNNIVLQKFGNNHDIIIRIASIQTLNNKIIFIVKQAVQGSVLIKRIEYIGPSIGKEMIQTGSIAILVALFCILFYLGYRFEWRLAIGSIIALIHDVIITLGVLSLFNIEIDRTIIASLMSVIGYSLNDSIVISDRIRENFQNIIYGKPYDIINVSLTQTLQRTIITSAITIAAIFILYIFGGAMLHSFSLTMLIGVTIGTISSIYVASSLALQLGIKREHIVLSKVEKEGANLF
ncbi:Protein translocase subunit SecF [Candidatus Profftia lariciata]|uniref:protein translocase subunit SecF n=1 Tax=Candidatus Profftia lariciata TaxID=1987921 RepID=UPI001D01738C|nr:protein translocase subunit SecF [Candidatus Profftia lariciata]UDG81791.1 Protein translocase subunit SecF [Candidatus Profftia lariciata]